MLVNRNERRATRSSGPDLRLLRPLIAVAVAAFFVPLAAPYITTGAPTQDLPGTANTQWTSLIAAVTALLAFRRMTLYPGARALEFILPAFSTTFGLAAVVLLVSRVSYSGSMLLAGYLASVSVTFLLGFATQRSAPMRLYYVPQGNVGIVSETPEIEWLRLEHPEIPPDPAATIAADLRADHSAEWERMLAQAALAGIPVYHTKQLRESLTGRVEIEHLSENSFGSLLPGLGYRGIKRLIDIVVSIVLIPILAIPLLVVALLIKVTTPGPIFFRQRRMGFQGVPFDMLKFRTMIPAGMVENGEDMRLSAITRDADDRITPLGRTLRRTRIDELPQLINILRGEMSWIGPRPEAVPLSEWYQSELPFYAYRHIVRPGITGWAQVNQGHVVGLDDVHVKLHYDFYYIKFFSAWLDVLIAFRTVGIMLSGFGAK